MEASSRSEFELKACASPEHLISRLNFHDESKLHQGKESAGPNEVLDADFSPHYMSVVDYVTSSTGTCDDIPQQLQAMLDDVKSVATSANTNVYKAADILETISDAVYYGRDAAKDCFNLDGKVRLSLDSFDRSFKKFLQDRMSSDVEVAEQELAICKQHLEEAISFARTDAENHKKRDTSEDELISLHGLEMTHETAVQDINEDEKDLTTILEKCSSDISTIDKSLRERESAMGRVRADFDRKKNKRDNELEQNRRRQQELNEELKKLEDREDELVRQNEDETNKVKSSDIEYQGVVEDITQWKARIEQLHGQAQASLKIIDTMKGFTSLVMEDAKRRKTEWKMKLGDMELTNCLELRDSLMAMASIHLMEVDDCKANVSVINNQISKNKEERKTLAQTGYKEGVRDAEARLKQLQDRFEEYKNKMKEHEERVTTFESELTKMDERIHQLKPNLQLDSLVERYSKRRKGINLVFEQDHIDAATFCSHGSYET